MLDAGSYKLKSGVLELIAGIALSCVDGVSGTGIRGDHPEDAKRRKHITKGIKAELNEGTVLVNLDVNMDYGRDFREVGRNVQREAKDAIEAMTDWPVEAVNVNVVGVNAL
ncbi:MAG: hypothetical protein A2V52_07420 [Actinobacteria bacterium RBG_19FT_COMBO_54_7]|nr:MAG: hypothetical protein A2V52_07420 [Actinobacteria bacterium RBG_19FT_COMBO_54_7]